MGLADDLGGTIREVAAATTLERIQPLMREFGITRVANVTGLDSIGIPVVTVVRPLARSLSVSQGKGVSLDLAKVSGIMESIEVFHAEQRRPGTVIEDIFTSRRNRSFVDPHRLPMRTDADLSVEQSIPWVEGDDLLDCRRRWIPEELLNLDFTPQDRATIFIASSNGLASGNTRAEAIVHALCEVIERDQTSFWSFEQGKPDAGASRRVNLATIQDPLCRPLVEKCSSAGLEVFVWHISINIDIPVFVCTIADLRGQTPFRQHSTGYGCHPSAAIALSRAITEAAQSRLTHISGLREDLTWFRYREEFLCDSGEHRDWLVKVSSQPATLDFTELCSSCPIISMDMPSILNHVLESLKKAGLESAVVVDLAVNETFSVVYACVPELEYATPKARTIYRPGPRMRQYLGDRGIKPDKVLAWSLA